MNPFALFSIFYIFAPNQNTNDEHKAMVNVVVPDDRARKLTFYLAMEEYLAHHGDAPEYLFTWTVEPTVIFGRNQFVENEVNLDYCREHGIMVVHRKSGGGCVYADKDNLMLSLVTKQENVGFAFNQYINMVLLLLRQLDVEAVGSRNNDIMVGERKVGGTACYKTGDHCIVHGTLLYDTNMEHMTHAITPSAEKLQHNGVKSVRQRIGLLKDHIAIGIDELKAFIPTQLCPEEQVLTEADIHGIEELEKKYEIVWCPPND